MLKAMTELDSIKLGQPGRYIQNELTVTSYT